MTPSIPLIGLGTAPIVDVDWAALVAQAVELGYTHVDTAQLYQNEAEVGAGLATADPEDTVHLTTKIHQDRFRDGTAITVGDQIHRPSLFVRRKSRLIIEIIKLCGDDPRSGDGVDAIAD